MTSEQVAFAQLAAQSLVCWGTKVFGTDEKQNEATYRREVLIQRARGKWKEMEEYLECSSSVASHHAVSGQRAPRVRDAGKPRRK